MTQEKDAGPELGEVNSSAMNEEEVTNTLPDEVSSMKPYPSLLKMLNKENQQNNECHPWKGVQGASDQGEAFSNNLKKTSGNIDTANQLFSSNQSNQCNSSNNQPVYMNADSSPTDFPFPKRYSCADQYASINEDDLESFAGISHAKTKSLNHQLETLPPPPLTMLLENPENSTNHYRQASHPRLFHHPSNFRVYRGSPGNGLHTKEIINPSKLVANFEDFRGARNHSRPEYRFQTIALSQSQRNFAQPYSLTSSKRSYLSGSRSEATFHTKTC